MGHVAACLERGEDARNGLATAPRSVRAALELVVGSGEHLPLEALLAPARESQGRSVLIELVEAALTRPDRVLAVGQTLGRHRWRVWELAGRDPARRVSGGPGLAARLEEAIQPTWARLWHEDLRVVARELDGELRLTVSSSGPPRPGAGGDVRLVVNDGLVVDPRRGRLRLMVESGARREALRAAMGELLFGDPSWFCGPTVTLAPLLVAPEAVLRPTRTVGQARIAGVELYGDAPGEVLSLSGGDVLGWLRRLDLGDQLDRLQAVALDLQLDTRAARVEIRPPQLVVYDRPREEPAVRAFLAERGLLGGAPRT